VPEPLGVLERIIAADFGHESDTLIVMSSDWHLYLDSNQLAMRGWTASLIERFLGEADLWLPVNHWANWTGKRTYFLERVELAEASVEFRTEFERSARRRKLSKKQVAAIEKCRSETAGAVKQWRDSEAAATRAETSAAPAPKHPPVSPTMDNDALSRRMGGMSKQELDMAEEFGF
jgi:hypothetical protein